VSSNAIIHRNFFIQCPWQNSLNSYSIVRSLFNQRILIRKENDSRGLADETTNTLPLPPHIQSRPVCQLRWVICWPKLTNYLYVYSNGNHALICIIKYCYSAFYSMPAIRHTHTHKRKDQNNARRQLTAVTAPVLSFIWFVHLFLGYPKLYPLGMQFSTGFSVPVLSFTFHPFISIILYFFI
jgi:hypothetical protein